MDDNESGGSLVLLMKILLLSLGKHNPADDKNNVKCITSYLIYLKSKSN